MRGEQPKLDDLFPYFCLVLGGIILALTAVTPPGESRSAAITAGSNLVTMGGTAYGTKLRIMRGDD